MKNKDKAITASNWKKVLREIYNYAPNNWGESQKVSKYDSNHELVKKLKISGQELGNTISFLEEQKLIKTNISNPKKYSAFWIITEKGFNVSRELEKEISNAFQQATIIFFTFILALTTLFSFIAESQNNENLFIWYVVSILMGISITTYIFKRSIK
ncbi:MAG: hypothetical protein ACOCUU_02460 [Nanoarchaeota archaeon]